MGVLRAIYYMAGWEYRGQAEKDAEEKLRLQKIYEDYEEKPVVASGYNISGQPKTWGGCIKTWERLKFYFLLIQKSNRLA